MCKYLPFLTNINKQSEYYLTDLPKIIKDIGKYTIKVWTLPKTKDYEMLNVNNPEELERANKTLQNLSIYNDPLQNFKC